MLMRWMLALLLLLGLFQTAPPPPASESIFTGERIFFLVALIASVAGHVVQFRNSRSGAIHEADSKSIASLEGALKRAETDRDVIREELRAMSNQLASVKTELAALMAIDVHELLGYAALVRRCDALTKENERLNDELARQKGEERRRARKGGGNE